MNQKKLFALALAAAVAGPAWSQNSDDSNPAGTDSSPYKYSSPFGSDGNPYGVYRNPYGSSDAPAGGLGSEPSGLNPYAGQTPGGLDGSSSGSSLDPYGLRGGDALQQPQGEQPNPYATQTLPSAGFGADLDSNGLRADDPMKTYDAEPPNPYGSDSLDEGASPARARTKAPAAGGDPSGLMGFNPYDANSILGNPSSNGGGGEIK